LAWRTASAHRHRRLSVRSDLTVAGHHAVATGVIASGFDGFGVDPVGHRVSIAIDDLGSSAADAVSLDVDFVSGPKTIAACQQPQLLTFSLQGGDFTVR
jgi:hypothetical protein